MSGRNENDQWLHNFYQQSFPNSSLSEATTVTTVTTTTTSPPALGVGTQLSPEGGVSKPTRRRSRASRRTPTTLLNTDTTNFRAMVQQFTGGPSVSSSAAAAANLPNLGLGFGSRTHGNPFGLVAAGPGYQQPVQVYQQQQQQYMYGGGDRELIQRLSIRSNNNQTAAAAGTIGINEEQYHHDESGGGVFMDHQHQHQQGGR